MLHAVFRKSINLNLLFVFGVLIIFFFLSVGMPMPPGFIYKLSENYLKSHPGYSDITSGSINPALLEQNVDEYNGYLMSVAVVIILNLVLYYFLFILSTVIIWNYLQKNILTLRGFWKSFLFNGGWLLFVSFISFLLYITFMFLGSFGAQLWSMFMSFAFVFSLFIFILLTLLVNYYIQKTSSVFSGLFDAFYSFKRLFFWLVLGVLITFILPFATSFFFYLPSVSMSLVTALVTIVQLVSFAWLHLYIAALLETEPQAHTAHVAKKSRK